MKILAICTRCHTQYDVTNHPPGDQLKCVCGAFFTVPEPRAAEARVVRCSSCGAAREGDSAVCAFCGSRFSMDDTGWGAICPVCCCRLPAGAEFCMECGLHLNPQPLQQDDTQYTCPRCGIPLHTRGLQDQITVQECSNCAGIWLSVASFNSICKEHESRQAAAHTLESIPHDPVRFEIPPEDPIRYLPCPHCRDLMTRQNFAHISGIIIDICRSCGVWLDNQELSHVIQFVESGELEKSQAFEIQEHLRTRALEAALPADNEIAMPLPDIVPGSAFFSLQRPNSGAMPFIARTLAHIARALTD